MPRSKGMVIGFWIVTALFCLQIGFTAYAQRLPQVAWGWAAAAGVLWLALVLLLAPRAGHAGERLG